MAAKKIGVIIAADGERQFAQAMQAAQKETKLFETRLKGLATEFKGSANSMEYLQKKQELLEKQQEAYTRKLEAAKSGQDKANKNYREQGKRLGELREQLEEARKSLQNMENAGEKGTAAYEKQEKAVTDLEKAIEKQDEARIKEAGNIADWERKVYESEKALKKANDEIEINKKYLKEAEQATDHCASSIDGMGNETNKAAKELEEFADAAEETTKVSTTLGDKVASALIGKGTSVGIDLLTSAAESLKESMYDISGASSRLAAQTGATEQQMKKYKEVMLSIRGNNFGEDYKDVSDAMALVIQTMGEMDDSSLQEVTESAITLRDTFGMDYQESIRAVKMLMDQFGISSQQAFNLIVQGAQQGLNKNGDLLDTINEYSVHYAQMGVSADGFFNSLKNGTDAGTFSVDKLGDAYKEFGIRVKDTAATTDEAYSLLGLDAEKMRRQFAQGGKSAEDATKQVLDALFDMDDSVKQNQAGVDLFGTMWEDLGISGVRALTKLDGSISGTKDAMEALKKVKYSDLESAISGLGAALQENIIAPVADIAIPLVTGLAQGAADALNLIGNATDPPKSKVQELIDSIEDANAEIAATIESTKGVVENADTEAEQVEYLGARLLKLNEIEDKTLTQKSEMSAVVQQLAAYIPDIAAAYDAETGAMSKSNGEIREMIDNKKALLIAEAQQVAMQELVSKELEAQQQLNKANEAEAAIIDQIGLLREEKELIENLYSDVDMDPEVFDTTMLEYWKKRLDDCTISQEKYDEIVNSGAYTYDMYFDRLSRVNNSLDEYLDYAGEAAEKSKKAQDNLNDLREAEEDLEKSGEDLAKSQGVMADTAKEGSESLADFGKSAEKTVPSIDEAAKQTLKLGGSYMEAAGAAKESAAAMSEAAEAGAEAQKEAAQSILDTYHGYVDEIEADLQNKISPFDKFDGGEDMTVESMLENLKSQTAGMEKYKENMQTITDALGDDIAPEFLAYIRSMGTDGANMLQHMVATLEQENGADLIRQMSDEYVKSMDMSEEIAETGAANRLAYEMATKEFGSSDAEFDGLRESVNKAVDSAAEGWAGLSKKTESAIDQAIQTAKDCGAKIPDGLAEGIASGETSPEEAIAALNGSIQGAFDGLTKMAQEAGVDIPPEIAAGIEAGGADAVEAYNQLIALISQKNPELKAAIENGAKADGIKASVEEGVGAGADAISASVPTYQTEGEKLGGAVAQGLDNSSRDITQAGEQAGKAGVDGLKRALEEYRKAGQDAGKRYADALSAARSQAVSAGSSLGSGAKSAAASWENSFYSVGYNMSAGVASGIRGGSGMAINAASTMAAKALAEAKSILDIHSPSGRFRQEVGHQIAAGMAFGIRDKASLAGRQAKKMSNKVYTSATSWLSKYKKKQQVSLADEKWYWQQVLKHTKKGTSAYNKALDKIKTINTKQLAASTGLSTGDVSKVLNNFGVSKTTGSGKKKKKKSTEDYYKEIYSAAEKYMSNQQAIRNISLQQELSYWQQVQKRLKKGTQGWYDAAKQIKSLKAEIADEKALAAEEKKQAAIDARQTKANVQQDMLDKYKVYYKVSAKAEAEYWNIARKQFTAGTDERIAADQKYLEAQQAWYDERKALDEEYKENSKKINDDLISDIKDLQDAYKDAVASRKQDILSQMNLFEGWDATGYSGEQLLHNLQTQVSGLALWEQQLEELGKKGIASDLMEELKQMGPEAAANIYSLNHMTAEQLKEYENLWKQKNDLAQSQAVKDSEPLRAETNKEITQLRTEAQSELNALNADYRAALDELNAGISKNLKNLVNKAGKIGEDAVSGLVAGIKAKSDSVETYKSTTKVVEKVSSQLSSLKKEGGAIGKSTLDGILAGLHDEKKINSAAQKTVQSIKYAMQEAADIHSPSSLFQEAVGKQISAGVGTGMEKGAVQAARSAQQMMRDTLAAAKEEMQKQQDTISLQAAALDFTGIARLNRLLETPAQPAPVVNINNDSTAALLGTLISAVNDLAVRMDRQQIVMDTGALVGAIQPAMSQESAAVMNRRSRGMRR